MAVAITVGVVGRMAGVDDANTTHLERSWRSGIAGPEHTSVVPVGWSLAPIEVQTATML